MRLFAGFLFRFFDFGFFGVVETVRVDVDGEPIFDGFNVFNEEIFENDGEADDDEEGGEDDFPGDVPAEDVLCGEEQDGAEGEHEEAAEFEPFRAETDEARDDNEEGPPTVKEQLELEQAESFAAEEDAKC